MPPAGGKARLLMRTGGDGREFDGVVNALVGGHSAAEGTVGDMGPRETVPPGQAPIGGG